MAKILTRQEVKNSAQQFTAQTTEQIQKQQAFARDLLQALEDKTNSDAAFQELSSLLTIPDEQFAILAPTFLEEMQMSYNDPQTQLALASIVNVYGYDEQTLQSEIDAMREKISTEFANVLSPIKLDFMIEISSMAYNAMLQVKGLAKKIVSVPICLCHEAAKLPEYAHLTDAGADVFAVEDIDIQPGETVLVPTGIKVAIPKGYEIQVRMKSGRAIKSAMRLANGIGTIDTGYRDEIKLIVQNTEPRIKDFELTEDGRVKSVLYGSVLHIGKGEKIAQLVLSQVPRIKWEEISAVDNIGEDRGGGFGSTGLYSAEDQKDGENKS